MAEDKESIEHGFVPLSSLSIREIVCSPLYEKTLIALTCFLIFNFAFSEAFKEISVCLAVLMGIPWVVFRHRERRQNLLGDFFRTTWPLWVFLGGSFLSALNSINRAQAMRGFWGDLLSLSSLFLFWTVLSFGSNPGRIVRWMTGSLYLGILFGGAVGVFRLVTKKTDFLGMMNLGDKNTTAQFLSFSLLILVALFFKRQPLALPGRFFAVFFPMLIVLILLCHSRAFLISLPVAVFVMLAIKGPLKTLFQGVGVVSLVILLLLAIAPVRAEIVTALAPTHDGSFVSRYSTWQGAIAMWKAHPLLGIGPDTFQMPNIHRLYHLQDYAAHGHNIFFNFLGEYGSVGVVSMTLWIILWGRTLRQRTREDGKRPWGVLLYAGTVTNMLLAGIVHPIWGASGSMLLMLIMCLTLLPWETPVSQRGFAFDRISN